MNITKTVVELPLEDYKADRETNLRILSALEDLKLLQGPQFLSRKEFMQKCRIASTKFHTLVKAGKMVTRKVGRMVYVPAGEVNKFFNGEFE